MRKNINNNLKNLLYFIITSLCTQRKNTVSYYKNKYSCLLVIFSHYISLEMSVCTVLTEHNLLYFYIILLLKVGMDTVGLKCHKFILFLSTVAKILYMS